MKSVNPFELFIEFIDNIRHRCADANPLPLLDIIFGTALYSSTYTKKSKCKVIFIPEINIRILFADNGYPSVILHGTTVTAIDGSLPSLTKKTTEHLNILFSYLEDLFGDSIESISDGAFSYYE